MTERKRLHLWPSKGNTFEGNRKGITWLKMLNSSETSKWVQIPTRKSLGLAGQEDVLEGNFFLEGKISPWLARNAVH